MPQTKTFYDVNGNPISDKPFYDVNGNPIGGNITSYTAKPGHDLESDLNAIKFDKSGAGIKQRGVSGSNENPKESYESLLRLLPAVGGMFGGIPGAGAGAFARQALTTNEPSIGSGALDTVMQGVLPKMIGALPNKITNLFTRTIPKAIATFENPVVNQEIQSTMSGLKNTAKSGGGAFTTTPPETGLVDAIDKGFNPVSNRFEPDKILEAIGKNPTGSPAENTTVDFLNKIKELDSSKDTGFMRYAKHRLFFHALGLFGGGGIGHAVGGQLGSVAGASGAIVLTNQAMKKIASSETLGKLALEAINTSPNTPKADLIGKVLMNGLRGTDLIYRTPEGKEEKVKVADDGSIQIPRQQQ